MKVLAQPILLQETAHFVALVKDFLSDFACLSRLYQ
jgi:hypothetical protein